AHASIETIVSATAIEKVSAGLSEKKVRLHATDKGVTALISDEGLGHLHIASRKTRTAPDDNVPLIIWISTNPASALNRTGVNPRIGIERRLVQCPGKARTTCSCVLQRVASHREKLFSRVARALPVVPLNA